MELLPSWAEGEDCGVDEATVVEALKLAGVAVTEVTPEPEWELARAARLADEEARRVARIDAERERLQHELASMHATTPILKKQALEGHTPSREELTRRVGRDPELRQWLIDNNLVSR